ncbi:MAG: hypothetical protein EPO10_13990 [Reyranella sp.]|uniref:hypothetical protein n=1 Tax=Reyranella sp. TaxID=1929291 RepID=UPI00120DCBB0|nr:hypothetical protein [Reyranella sp.]TAJ93052.1 MAG: hypothetical protein EPO41_12440 [Reyranella sp.]TBR28249.1 MAG: hypothetical protein EPO10_13990 [Reyranella sp.]
MSHSDPSDSSADPLFLVGADLVEFDRRDLPIYATPASHWAEAGVDAVSYGAPLDRLYGEPGQVFVDGVAGAAADVLPSVGEDALVALSNLSDGLMLPASEEPFAMHESAAVYDFGADAHVVMHVQDGITWDQADAGWSFDHAG